MTRFMLPSAMLAAMLAFTPPAQAQNGSLTRSFVSSTGSNSNPCTITLPCASFAQAYTVIGANGIVAALDPGKYGPITIIGPVTINGNGWAAITGPAQNNAITINANSSNGDVVTLTGLEIDGAGAAYNGIVFNSGGTLTITNCVVQNFVYDGSHQTTGNGILLDPITGTVNFAITNTTASNNGWVGIFYFPTSAGAATYGTIDHVVATKNQYGIAINLDDAGGSPWTTVDISNSIASNNNVTGIYIANPSSNSQLAVSIDNTNASENQYGIASFGAPNVTLGRSVITANRTYGIDNETATFYSYQDNRINGNGTSGTINSNASDIHLNSPGSLATK
jgi:hypothetical protein